ncbi:hypothetical protein [Sphingobacterium hotanense]|uniref:C2H2-type domain-containing protein n=1 Tax=Sphingobacterium hotanense TaxID=649196 RepID=A0ABT7NQI1_9SPHI|nr:hypothetical protein [Sphingobacterium hotanense]MDM1049502.1 hypothetical protein [Sphingobacterium hotanense]
MKEISTTIFKCDHCNKNYLRKYAAVNHESKCFHNPTNFQPCLNGCKHLGREDVTIEVDNGHGGYKFTANAFLCKKKNQLMYPLSAKRLHDKYDLESHDQIQMPLLKCDDFEKDDFISIFDI